MTNEWLKLVMLVPGLGHQKTDLSWNFTRCLNSYCSLLVIEDGQHIETVKLAR